MTLRASRFTRRSMQRSPEWPNCGTDEFWSCINTRWLMTLSRCGSHVNRNERRSLFTRPIIRRYG